MNRECPRSANVRRGHVTTPARAGVNRCVEAAASRVRTEVINKKHGYQQTERNNGHLLHSHDPDIPLLSWARPSTQPDQEFLLVTRTNEG